MNSAPNVENPTILVAGSTEGMPELVRNCITDVIEGADVTVVSTQSLQRFTVPKSKPDLVILTNYNLPGIDIKMVVSGITALGIAVLILVDEFTREKAAKLGDVSLMEKPARLDDYQRLLPIALDASLHMKVTFRS